MTVKNNQGCAPVEVVKADDAIHMSYESPETGRRLAAEMIYRRVHPVVTFYDCGRRVAVLDFEPGTNAVTSFRMMRLCFNGLLSARLKGVRYRRNRRERKAAR